MKRNYFMAGLHLTEQKKDVLFGYALLLPTFAVFALVVLYPIVNGVVMSFFEYTFFTVNKTPTWNNFANYINIFQSGFLKYLGNTVVFTVGTVGLELIIGMGIALLLNMKIRGSGVLRSVFLMPWTVPSIVVALLWSWLFQAQFGIINHVFSSLGLISNPNMEWIQSPSTAMLTVIVAAVWRQTPYMLVMILAGLQSIRQDLVEAAAIDGASSITIFFKIKLPSIKAVLGTTVITCIMASFQQFTIIYNMTSGGPLSKTTTMSIAAYKQAFSGFDLGSGAAIGVIWMLILGTAISIYNVKTKRFDSE